MPVNPMTEGHPNEVFENQGICRVVRCERGEIELDVVCQPRFQYGAVVPHTSLVEPNVGYAHGGIDALAFLGPTPVTLGDSSFRTTCRLKAGETAEYAAHYSWRQEYSSQHFEYGELEDLLEAAKAYWREWSAAFSYKGLYQTQVLRSALTLKALTYAPTGGIVAAATTSLPEEVGGERNWDYRYTWIRDATFAIYALNLVGFIEEANAFKRWLKRATAGRAQDLQIMYGLAGERRLAEFSLDHLEGYRGSRPVRIGNGAHTQLQLDIFGEVLDSAYLYRKYCGEFDEEYWQFCRDVVEFVMQSWREPDEGIWETRGGRKHFIFSKVMCWVALDRAIRVSDSIAWDDQAEIERWKAAREEIKEGRAAPRLRRAYRRLRSILRQRQPRRVGAHVAPRRLHQGVGPAHALHHRADRAEPDVAPGVGLPLQGLRRRPRRPRGHVQPLLVLARGQPDLPG